MTQNQILPLKELEVEARRVLVRVNLDTPLQNQKMLTDTYINAAMPTINYLIENGARVVLAGHLGDPKGKVNPKLSLEPIAAHLAAMQHIGEVFLSDSCTGDGAKSVIAGLREGQICVLENLAFHAGEFQNDEKLAKQLASFCDIYVNESFSLNDRVLASTNGILKHARIKVMGFQFAKELGAFKKFLTKPERPVVAILSGKKITDNLELLENLLPMLDTLILGGPMVNTFAAATGGNTGKAEIDHKKLPLARDIIDRALRRNIKLLLPVDVKAGSSADTPWTDMLAGDVPDDMDIFDLGSKTIEKYRKVIRKAGTILWKGRMGMTPSALDSTQAIAKAISGSSAISLTVGNEISRIIRDIGLEKGFNHVSDGAGATIKMLEGKTLPTLVAMGTLQTMK